MSESIPSEHSQLNEIAFGELYAVQAKRIKYLGNIILVL